MLTARAYTGILLYLLVTRPIVFRLTLDFGSDFISYRLQYAAFSSFILLEITSPGKMSNYYRQQSWEMEVDDAVEAWEAAEARGNGPADARGAGAVVARRIKADEARGSEAVEARRIEAVEAQGSGAVVARRIEAVEAQGSGVANACGAGAIEARVDSEVTEEKGEAGPSQMRRSSGYVIFPPEIMEYLMCFMTTCTLLRLASTSSRFLITVWNWLNRSQYTITSGGPFPIGCTSCVNSSGERFPCICRSRCDTFTPVDISTRVHLVFFRFICQHKFWYTSLRLITG